MPELPEVQTTVSSLQKVLPGQTIKTVWSDLPIKKQKIKHFKETLKDFSFYQKFQKQVVGKKVLQVERRAKNILIHLSNDQTILVHMKMTGHLLYGIYSYNKKENSWGAVEKGPLQNPLSRFIHVVFTLSNGKHLTLSDARKFAKVTLISTKDLATTKHLKHLGPEPLTQAFTYPLFKERLGLRPKGKIKTVLMDQHIISGIGNIYSDEALWLVDIHPETRVSKITDPILKKLYQAVRKILTKGINFGGDSTSDYRNIDGKPGKFHHHHNVYQKKGQGCSKRGCTGVILRKVIGGRSAHFCSKHQILIK